MMMHFMNIDEIINVLTFTRTFATCTSHLLNSITSGFYYYYLRQGGNVFARVCLSVCLSVCQQHEKLWTDLDEIFRKCPQWDQEQLLKF